MLFQLLVAAAVALTVPSSLWHGDAGLAPASDDGGGAPVDELSQGRQLAGDHEHDHADGHTDELGEWQKYDPLIRLGVFLLSVLVWVLGTLLYWHMYIRGTPDRYVPLRVVVPDDLKGNWAHGMCECLQAPGTCLCFTFCHSCAIADLWYRAGWVHGVLGRSAQQSPCGSCCGGCPGWQYFVGVLGVAFLYSVECCTPCGLAILRGGARFIDGGDGGMTNVEDHRKRFDLPHEGWSTFCGDCCLWFFCGPCLGTQEWRQISDLLGRGDLQQAPAPGVVPGQVVGVPVVVQGNKVP